MAFSNWMNSPMPMVTVTKTMDITRLCRAAKRRGMKLNMLMCWCIGKAAAGIGEFYLLPKDGKLYRFDRLAINIVVSNSKGGINICDVPYSEDIDKFNEDYRRILRQCAAECRDIMLDDHNIIGTSALPQCELDCIVNQYSGKFNNPFIAWGKYRRRCFRKVLPMSFQFHHAQLDGSHVVRFLENLQAGFRSL